MKRIIEDYYSIHILGYIKISNKTYKIKTSECFYYLKFTDDYDFEEIIDYIESIHLKCFVNIIKNKNNHVLTAYNDQFFYLMEELNNSKCLFKEAKIKSYFQLLSYIHSHSCYNIKVNQEYFKQIYNDIIVVISERLQYYNNVMNECEQSKYRSPSQWLFLLNYYRIHDSLKEAEYYLKLYMNKVKDCQINRVCLIYKHFHYDHIFLKHQKLISLDQMQINMPIYDIYDIYKKLPDILFDLDCFSEYYLKNMKLDNKEILLLCTLLKIVPIIYLENDEVNNIIKISRLLYYLDSINSLCKHLDNQNDGEFR